MFCKVYLKSADCLFATLSPQERQSGLVIINDPDRLDTDRQPALQYSTIYRLVFANLTIGALTGLAGAADGCPTVLKYDQVTANKLSSVCQRHQVSKYRRPSPEVYSRMIADVGIPFQYGSEVVHLLATRLLSWIQRHVHVHYRALSPLTHLGVKLIVDGAVALLARSGAFDPSDLSTPPPPVKVGRRDVNQAEPISPPATPGLAAVPSLRTDLDDMAQAQTVDRSRDLSNQNRARIVDVENEVDAIPRDTAQVQDAVHTTRRDVNAQQERIQSLSSQLQTDIRPQITTNANTCRERYDENHDRIEGIGKAIKKMLSHRSAEESRMQALEDRLEQDVGQLREESQACEKVTAECIERTLNKSNPESLARAVQDLRARQSELGSHVDQVASSQHETATDMGALRADLDHRITPLSRTVSLQDRRISTLECSDKHVADALALTQSTASVHDGRIASLESATKNFSNAIFRQVLDVKNPASLATELKRSQDLLERFCTVLLDPHAEASSAWSWTPSKPAKKAAENAARSGSA